MERRTRWKTDAVSEWRKGQRKDLHRIVEEEFVRKGCTGVVWKLGDAEWESDRKGGRVREREGEKWKLSGVLSVMDGGCKMASSFSPYWLTRAVLGGLCSFLLSPSLTALPRYLSTAISFSEVPWAWQSDLYRVTSSFSVWCILYTSSR